MCERRQRSVTSVQPPAAPIRRFPGQGINQQGQLRGCTSQWPSASQPTSQPAWGLARAATVPESEPGGETPLCLAGQGTELRSTCAAEYIRSLQRAETSIMSRHRHRAGIEITELGINLVVLVLSTSSVPRHTSTHLVVVAASKFHPAHDSPFFSLLQEISTRKRFPQLIFPPAPSGRNSLI